MNHSKRIVLTLAVLFAAFLAFSALVLVAADKAEVKRNLLTRQDLATFPGHEGVMAQVEFAPGSAEPKHTHPGEVFGYVQEGTVTLNIEGKPTVHPKAGDTFFIPANTVHWGVNEGSGPAKVLATFVVPKGQPMTTPAAK